MFSGNFNQITLMKTICPQLINFYEKAYRCATITSKQNHINLFINGTCKKGNYSLITLRVVRIIDILLTSCWMGF